MASRAKLVDAAKNLNEVLALDPAIDVTNPVATLEGQIKEAAGLLEEKDEVTAATQAVIDELTGEGEAEKEEEGETKTEVKTKPARGVSGGKATTAAVTKKAPPAGGFRYEGSTAQKMDVALVKGGNLEKLADDIGVKKGVLRQHAKFREKGGKFTLTENEETGHIKLTAVAAE